ncbi:hypothetical protein PHYBOEH_004779 [Phytophthora boehmeriae]|uniref:Uncharacterized protein n=1 Tax=Phytophthora boehmeriae TaxID=109152 RepID=A0A8T1WL05_9STRA|nr:hypothetical protein PHYBOEH_004779 [Phytophthora boehmeriae]
MDSSNAQWGGEMKACSSRTPTPKCRKKAHAAIRKEEIGALREEVKTLLQQVAQLRENAKRNASDQRSTLLDVLRTEFIRQAVREQGATLVNVQSALSRIMLTLPRAPHDTEIHLVSDRTERRMYLTKLKPVKLRAAHLYLNARGRFVNQTSAFFNATQFLDHDGCYRVQMYEVVPFEGVSSVKRVYDALLHYFSTMEIRVTESLGDITIREDDGSSAPGITQFRFVSYLSSGPQFEMNNIICSEFKEVDHEFGGGRAVGIFVEDFVDLDDLYPYVPDKRIRQDVTVVTRIRSHIIKRYNADGNEEEETIVVFERSAHTKTHKSNLGLTAPVIQEIRGKCARWGDVKLAAVREMVYRPGARKS